MSHVRDSSTSVDLLDRARRRERDAWDRLISLYSPLVEYWCHLWGVNGADAEDVRQDVFQSVSTKLDGFRRDRPGDTFRGWLRVITQHKIMDARRRQAKQPEGQGGSDAHRRMLQIPDSDEVKADEAPEEVKRLHQRALELIRTEFEEKTWHAFLRCAVDGQAPVDVGKDLHMSPAAVRKAKSRVLRRLKEELGDLLM